MKTHTYTSAQTLSSAHNCPSIISHTNHSPSDRNDRTFNLSTYLCIHMIDNHRPWLLCCSVKSPESVIIEGNIQRDGHVWALSWCSLSSKYFAETENATAFYLTGTDITSHISLFYCLHNSVKSASEISSCWMDVSCLDFSGSWSSIESNCH